MEVVYKPEHVELEVMDGDVGTYQEEKSPLVEDKITEKDEALQAYLKAKVWGRLDKSATPILQKTLSFISSHDYIAGHYHFSGRKLDIFWP